MDNVYKPGRYYYGFWMEMIHFPKTLNTIEFSEEPPESGVQHLSVLRSRDRDGKRIFLDVSVQYRLHENKIGKLYSEMLIFYEDVYITQLRDALAKACNQYAIADAWLDYEGVTAIMHDACVKALDKYHAECWGLQLWGIRLESRYEKALIRTQVRKQAQKSEVQRKAHMILRAETAVLLADYKKNKTILEAQGEADRFLIKEEAMAAAEQNKIDAQAKVVKMVQNLVALPKRNLTLNQAQLMKYQKLLMIQQQAESNFLVHSEDDLLDPINAQAFKELAQGSLSGALPTSGNSE